MRRPKLTPLRNVPVEIIADGRIIWGLVRWVYPNDMEVEIVEPFAGLKTGLHVPHFAMHECNRLATCEGRHTVALTPRGRQRAERLLRVLYDHARGHRGGWPVEQLTPDGSVRVEPGTE